MKILNSFSKCCILSLKSILNIPNTLSHVVWLIIRISWLKPSSNNCKFLHFRFLLFHFEVPLSFNCCFKYPSLSSICILGLNSIKCVCCLLLFSMPILRLVYFLIYWDVLQDRTSSNLINLLFLLISEFENLLPQFPELHGFLFC